MKYSILALVAAVMLTGCVDSRKLAAKEAAARDIVVNRKTFAKEILAATNECIKNANTLTQLIAAGNDAEETVSACSRQAQKAYGASSPWQEQYLLEYAYAR